MLAFEKKLENLEMKLDGIIATKLDGIIAKQQDHDVQQKRSDEKQDAVLKLLAAVHVKLDDPKPIPHTNRNEVPDGVATPEIPLEDIEGLYNFEMTMKNEVHVANALVTTYFTLFTSHLAEPFKSKV